jgi:two-component system sensor histidine kinase KdpD
VTRLLEKVRENFGLISVALLHRHGDGWQRVASTGTDPCSDPAEADTEITVDEEVRLAIGGKPLTASDRAVVEAAAGQAVLSLR